MKVLKTKYGDLTGVVDTKSYDSGSLKSCILNCENRIQTPVGEMIPQYRLGEAGERQKKYRSSLSFFPNGQLKSASLDRQMEVQTPLSPMQAELVTFYESGGMNRLFPLNGKIDAFWSELHEREIAEPMTFHLKVGSFTAKVMCIHFYPSGALKSISLWPDEKITLRTPQGPMLCRAGFSLYEDGSLKSLEPARPAKLLTWIGEIVAFDPDILGIHGDQNSIQFAKSGALLSAKTVHSGIEIWGTSGNREKIEPIEIPSLIHDDEMQTVPLKLDFSESLLKVQLSKSETRSFEIPNASLMSYRVNNPAKSGCIGCSGCSDNSSCCS